MNDHPRPSIARWLAFAAVALAFQKDSTKSFAIEILQSTPVSVTTTVSNDRLHVAEPFIVDLKVTASVGTQVALPAIGMRVGEFEVVDHQDIVDLPARDLSDHRVWSRRLTLESMLTGDLEVPAFEIYAVKGSESQIVKSDPIPIHVISVFENRADRGQLREIDGVVDVTVPPSQSNRWVGWIAIGAGGLVLAAACVVIATQRRTWLTPSQWALQALQTLEDSEGGQDANSETVSRELSLLLRDYLELQFEISAPVNTTQELLIVVASRQLLDAKMTTRFAYLFETADQAKFAAADMTPAEIEMLIGEARQLVEETSRLPVSSAANTKGSD